MVMSATNNAARANQDPTQPQQPPQPPTQVKKNLHFVKCCLNIFFPKISFEFLHLFNKKLMKIEN